MLGGCGDTSWCCFQHVAATSDGGKAGTDALPAAAGGPTRVPGWVTGTPAPLLSQEGAHGPRGGTRLTLKTGTRRLLDEAAPHMLFNSHYGRWEKQDAAPPGALWSLPCQQNVLALRGLPWGLGLWRRGCGRVRDGPPGAGRGPGGGLLGANQGQWLSDA